jgi:hypothetical protein
MALCRNHIQRRLHTSKRKNLHRRKLSSIHHKRARPNSHHTERQLAKNRKIRRIRSQLLQRRTRRHTHIQPRPNPNRSNNTKQRRHCTIITNPTTATAPIIKDAAAPQSDELGSGYKHPPLIFLPKKIVKGC